MAYERQKFKNGQVLKAEHLACIEDCLCDMSPVADSFKFSSDCIGKAIRVLAVDDAGRPTKWETVDIPDTSEMIDKNSIVQDAGQGEDVIMSQKAVSNALDGKQPSGNYALRSEIPSVPVKSVNGKTGAVNLTAADVKARPETWMPSASEVGALPAGTKIPAKTSDLTNDSGFLTGYTETDPTVPAWAKASSKPSYSKSEVGLGNVENVKQYSASNPPPYPVTSVNGKTGAVSLGAADVGADLSGTAASAVSAHNQDDEAHQDIRKRISQLSNEKADKFDPTVYGLPVLYLEGDTSPIAVSKDNKVTLDYVYGERSGTCTLKGQGATSYKTAQALVNAGKAGKFNYTIKFDTAFEVKEGWGAQEKYCLKANFIDTTHSRNICSCKLWGMSVKARSPVPAEMANLPNGGAVDGFPIVIMLNGKFHGLYTWNIPKDGWMFGLVEDTTKTQAIVGADDHTAATQMKEASLTGFEVEFVSDEDNAAWVETSLTRMISAVMNSTGYDLDNTVGQYLDFDSCIDHYIHTVVDKAGDCVDKNYLLVTYDGVKWYMSEYDRDSIHCLNWDASGTTRPVSNVSFVECAETVKIYELIKRFKTDALKARYKELRSNILSESRIMQVFENFAWAIPSPVMLEDVKLYPTILGSGVNTIDQIGRAVRQRLETCDAWISALPAQETPVVPEEPEEMVNLVPTSTDTDGSIYNGVGYKDDTRLSSSGGVSGTAQAGSVTTGFIPYAILGIVRIKGGVFNSESGKHYYLNFYSGDKSLLRAVSAEGVASGNVPGISVSYDGATEVTTIDVSNGYGDWFTAIQAASFIRMTVKGSGADLIVTVNQEITE